MVARGRISLLEAVAGGELQYTKRLKDLIGSCIHCLRCQANCPSGVDYDAVLHAARAALARARGVPVIATGIFSWVLPRRTLLDAFLRAAAVMQRALPLKRRGRVLRLPLVFMGRRWVPALAPRSALERYRAEPVRRAEPAAPSSVRRRVGFFTGCLINYLYPEIADAAVSVLTRLGCDVVVPRGQVCCGAPVLSFGDVRAACTLAERNFEAFRSAGVSRVITACAIGGHTLRHEYERLAPGEWRRAGIQVRDISEFIADECDWQEALESTGGGGPLADLQVTYHDPCHLNWGQGIAEQPRELLEACTDFTEMSNADRCCGNGSTFSLFHYDLSIKIAEHKLDAIRECGADMVATGCPACIMHLSDRLADAGSTVAVIHTVQALEAAFTGGAPPAVAAGQRVLAPSGREEGPSEG